ncbi:MAG TPA: ribonuclease R [Prolixibacteraceae bacterium]|nr:ribonuclease R [Prolixibacteraceae bacterium]
MSKKKKSPFKSKMKGLNKKELKKVVLEFFYQQPEKVFNLKQIIATVKIEDPNLMQLIGVALEELTDDGYLLQPERGKFKLKAKTGYVVGTIEMTQKGYGFVITDEMEEDIFVAGPNLNRAMNGDKVRVYLNALRKRKQPEGEVVEIIERAKTSFVGVISMSRNFAFLVPTGKNDFDIFIPKDKLKGAKQGQKAVAKIIDWPAHAKNPFGEIIDVLGEAGQNDTEMHAILAEFDLPYKFPESVNKAAERISVEIPPEEIAKRRDFRQVPTFTIDPGDAKDFDDALSIQKLKNGHWEVGVHIADVSYYVPMNSLIEKEAYERATSVYLVDRVVPMLPEKLSNGVCSLNAHEDKLCFAAVFEIDDEATVKKQWIGRTVINSDRRFTYEEAQQIIETGEGDMKEQILTLNDLAKKLRSQRFQSGAISFDRAEVKFNLDEKGKPLGVYFKEAKESNQLIEEFMLLANKKVAEFIGKPTDKSKPKTFVYRIHDRPDPDKLTSFNNFIGKFGYGIDMNTPNTISRSINKLLLNVKGHHEENVISTLAVRSMAKAVYSTRNIGHYGLSFDYYTHFTSPIRRYPDLMVHRLLERYLESGRSVNVELFEEKCRHSSNMEQRAVQAERSSIKYKQVEFMQDKVGTVFAGVISGVTDWGIYVELEENGCEGMVSIKDLTGDFYFFDEKNYCISGMHTDKCYQLGADVKVELVRANLEKKQIDFRLVEEGQPSSAVSNPENSTTVSKKKKSRRR